MIGFNLNELIDSFENELKIQINDNYTGKLVELLRTRCFEKKSKKGEHIEEKIKHGAMTLIKFTIAFWYFVLNEFYILFYFYSFFYYSIIFNVASFYV